jgi:hypothetical protein
MANTIEVSAESVNSVVERGNKVSIFLSNVSEIIDILDGDTTYSILGKITWFVQDKRMFIEENFCNPDNPIDGKLNFVIHEFNNVEIID